MLTELGHGLTLGQASPLDCGTEDTSSSPSPHLTGHLERISLPGVSHTPEAVPTSVKLCYPWLPNRLSESFLLIAAHPPHPAFGLELRFPMMQVQACFFASKHYSFKTTLQS